MQRFFICANLSLGDFMIQRNALYHIPYYNKAAFTGSYQGMHYKLEKIKGNEDTGDTLKATVWPGPFCCDATPDEKKEAESFDFSEDGITAACDWLNQKYQEQESLYTSIHI